MEKTFRVGFCRLVMNPEESIPLTGFSNEYKRFHQNITEDICATTVAITDEDDNTVLIIQADFCTMFDKIGERIRTWVNEATGVPINLFLSHEHGGIQQVGARIAYNEIDMVLFFDDPASTDLEEEVRHICRLCDQHNVPFASNVATAEVLIHGLSRGDLDWRDIVNPTR